MLEFLVEVVARFVAVTALAFAIWCTSGFRKSYRSEWRRLFDKYSGAYEWIDLIGLAITLSVGAGIVFIVLALTNKL